VAPPPAETATSNETVERVQAELKNRERALAEARAETERLNAELTRRQDALATATAEAAKSQLETERLRTGLAVHGERLAITRAALGEARRQRRRLARELPRQTEALATAESALQRSEAEVETLRAALARQRDELQRRDEETQATRAEIVELRAKVASGQQSAVRAEKELDDVRAALGTARAEIDRLSAELSKREIALAQLRRMRYVQPRKRLRALSHLASWLVRGRWRHFAEYLRLRRDGTFHAEAYLAENPDVEASCLDPLMHYIEHGIREGRALAPAPTQPAIAEPLDVAASPAKPVPRGKIAPRVFPAPPPGPLPPSDYSDFVVLLSRQRSGTNALRSILATHPDVFSFNEVFNLPDRDSEDPLLRESNFFTFVERHAGGDVRQILPDHHERLFLDFLDYLRCLSDKRYAIIDVKYNMTHLLASPWLRPGTPYLFKLLARHRLHVLSIRRRNYLRYLLSVEKANHSGLYTVDSSQRDYSDQPYRLNPLHALREISSCAEEDELIGRCLTLIDDSLLLELEYADLFPGDGTVIAPDSLSRFSAWLGISNQFDLDPEYRKQSSLPLHEAIENYDEIVAVLQGTPFASCLGDEPAYRALGTR
jgi:predicted  nucleic acid-binding Zn-ribbon protein